MLGVALFLWQAMHQHGWLGAVAGSYSTYFWAGLVIWAALAVLAVRQRQHWWVIAVAPFALYPVAMLALLLAACGRGNCL